MLAWRAAPALMSDPPAVTRAISWWECWDTLWGLSGLRTRAVRLELHLQYDGQLGILRCFNVCILCRYIAIACTDFSVIAWYYHEVKWDLVSRGGELELTKLLTSSQPLHWQLNFVDMDGPLRTEEIFAFPRLLEHVFFSPQSDLICIVPIFLS